MLNKIQFHSKEEKILQNNSYFEVMHFPKTLIQYRVWVRIVSMAASTMYHVGDTQARM